MEDGDALTFRDRTWIALARPGHSPTDTLFVDEKNRVALTGDHLMVAFPSNPFFTRALVDDGGSQMLTYVASLERTLALDLDVALPGHGEPFSGLVDVGRRWARRRAALMRKLSALLADGPTSAFELATRLAGRRALSHPEAVVSDVVGHLDLLVDERRAERVELPDGELRYRRTS